MTRIEILKDVFFLSGSVLGIIAFIKTTINPLLNENREKWKKFLQIFDDEFFQGLEFLHQTRSVEKKQLSKIWFFLDEIRENKDYLVFKFPNKTIFDKHIKNLVKLAEKFNEEITPPIWSRDFPQPIREEYTLNKEYFRQEFDHHEKQTKEYLKHLHYATDLATKMRMEFRALQAIADMHFIELPFKRWIVNKAKSKISYKLFDQ